MQLMLASEEFEEKVDPEFGIGLKLMFGRIIGEYPTINASGYCLIYERSGTFQGGKHAGEQEGH